MVQNKQFTSSHLLEKHSCVHGQTSLWRSSLCGRCGHSLDEWCLDHQQQLHTLDHHKPVQNLALCPERHSPEEVNVDQVLNTVLENSMAEKYEMCVHPVNLKLILRCAMCVTTLGIPVTVFCTLCYENDRHSIVPEFTLYSVWKDYVLNWSVQK